MDEFTKAAAESHKPLLERDIEAWVQQESECDGNASSWPLAVSYDPS